MPRFALVGGAGFIGSHLARLLKDAGDEVVVLDTGESYGCVGSNERDEVIAWRRKALLDDIKIIEADTRDASLMSESLARFGPSHVIHLGNIPLADVAARDRAGARRNIVTGTRNLLGACAALPRPPRFVYVSSSMIYGHFLSDPQGEDAPARPVNAYGQLKLAAERAVAASRLEWTVVRPASVYGPGDANGRLLSQLVAAAATGRALSLACPPATRLDFTWVGDVASGIQAAACGLHAAGRVYNLSSGRARSVADALTIVARHAPELRVLEEPATNGRPRRGTLDIARAQRELGWSPVKSLESGLAAYLAQVRELVSAMA